MSHQFIEKGLNMKRYHPILVALLWLLAIMILGELIMGGYVLGETPNSDPFKMISQRMHMGMMILMNKGAALAHGIFATALTILIVVHIAAGLFHQFVRKDSLFRRM